ncbi:MAG: hypothetical protein ICV69_11195 [Thermoleophilaceae bacterium]|nr:hypothetical protein [Thermoleophilaceae bacterium]
MASTDIDALETAEWLDSLESVLEHDGTERASFLLDRLIGRAWRAGACDPVGRLHRPRGGIDGAHRDRGQGARHPTLSETVAFSAEAAEGTITDLYIPKRGRTRRGALALT